VTLTLSQPYAPFPAVLSELWILAPESEGWAGTITRPIGTGPFQFGTWTPKVRLVAPAHPQYWKPGRPYASTVQFDLRDAEDNSLALRSGDLHIARVPQEKVKTVQADPQTEIQYFKDTTWYFWSFNNRSPRPPFNNLRVREAIAYSLDKAAYMKYVGGETGVVSDQMATPGTFYWDKAMEGADRHAKPDLARARKILQEEGVDPAAITMRVVSWVNAHSQIAVQMVKQLGFKVEHIALDDLGAQKRLGQYDWDLAPFSSGPRADVFFRYVRLMSDGPNPVLWGGVQDPELDRLINSAVGTVDAGKRRALYLEAWKRIMERYYTLVIGHIAEPIGVRKEVRGYRTGFTWSQHWLDGGLAETWLAR
jgi:ABC-type transport system substrate-binding protein